VVIAGSGPTADEARLRRLIQQHDLGGRVRLAGRVEGEAKQRLLAGAALLVMPSRFEASPLVMVEAFAHGVPVVCFGIPELSDTPAACAVQVAPFDVPQFAEALRKLARDPARREALGTAARAYARGFDWDLLARRYADFFESLAPAGVGSAARGR
jgi:glycosyltransferase involved in cell wall biosynthesis